MSRTNTNTNTKTNTGTGDINRSHNAGRGRQDQGGYGGQGRGGRGNDHGNSTIARYSFEGKMKDGPLSKLTITKGGQQATQYKEIIDALPVFCVDKGYRFIDDIICTNTELLEAAFLPTYLDPALWSFTYHVQLDVVDPLAVPDPQGVCVLRTEMQQKSRVFDPNLQKQLLSNYD